MTVLAVAALLIHQTDDEREVNCECDERFWTVDGTLAAYCTSGYVYVANDNPIHRCESLTKDDEFDAFQVLTTLMPLVDTREALV